MQTRTLGRPGLTVSEIGLGAMGMSDLYGPADEDAGIATVHAALDAGITLIDTGDFYGLGANEMLLAKALRGRKREEVVISVKFGALRTPDGGFLGHDGRPAAVNTFLAYTLKRLGVDYVDVYRPARVDPTVPIEDTVGAIAELIGKGYVRHVGLSEAGAETLRRAHAVHPVADLQIEYSLLSRGVERSILPTARELGVAITAYGVLGRGMLSGHWRPERQLAPEDYRSYLPRFHPDNLQRNLELVAALTAVADSLGATPAQVAIAWSLSRGPDIVPLVGARRPDRLAEALGAVDLQLGPDDLARIEQAVPEGSAAGERDAPEYLPTLDSEKS